MQKLTLVAAVAAAMTLAACGGGGSSDAGSTESFAATAAWNNLYAADRSWHLEGTDNASNPWTVDLAIRLGTDSTYPLTGAAGRQRHLDSSATLRGVSQGSGTATYYLDPTSNALVGVRTVDTATGEATCATMTGSVLPPSAAPLGGTGVLANWTSYDGCLTGAAVTGTGVSTWRLTAESGTNYFCVESSSTEGTTTTGEQDCFQIDTAGNIGTKGRVTVLTVTPTARYELIVRTL